MLQEQPHFYDRHINKIINKILNRNGFGEGNDTNQGRRVFLILLIFGGFSLEKIILRITIYSNIFIFMTVTNNIYQKQIKYHVFNAVKNSELTELVPVFTTWPAFPTSVKKSKHIIQKCLADMGTGITNVIGGPHDLLPPRSDRSDEFQKLCQVPTNCYIWRYQFLG